MNNKPSYFILILFVLLFSCSRKEAVKDDDIQEETQEETQEEVKDTVKVQSISLGFSKVEIQVGGTYRFSPAIYPENATDKTLNWTSTDTGIADVSDGLVRGISAGAATIYATAVCGGATAACKVSVVGDSPQVTVPLESISLMEKSLTLKEGEPHYLKVTFIPGNATDTTVFWSSDNEALVTVTDGTVHALRAPEPDKAGPVTVTATSKDGGFTAECKVSVICDATAIELNETTLALKEKEKYRLVATVIPSRATSKAITWKSENTGIATVSQDGEVTAISKGSTVITVSLKDGDIKATCAVAVNSPIVSVTGVTLNSHSRTMNVGETYTLQKTVTPSNATNTEVDWSSSKPDVVSVDGSGKLTAVSAGEATITVNTKDGGYTDNCKVTVKQPTVDVTDIVLNPTLKSIQVGESFTITATVKPDNATNKTLIWSSDEPSICTVDKAGKVTGKLQGTANVTATSNNGKKGVCVITVKPKQILVTGVKLNVNQYSMTAGDTYTLQATVSPSNATNKSVTWKSSNSNVVKVSGGTLTAVAAGEATITVTTSDGGFTDNCKVTVKAKETVKVTYITLNPTSRSLRVGESFTITAEIRPDNATDKTLKWDSINKGVATVTSAGLVKAVAEGTTTIIATANDGSGRSATCSVTVVPSQTTIHAEYIRIYCEGEETKSLSIHPGETRELEAVVYPENANNRNVGWEHNMVSGQVASQIIGNRYIVTACGYEKFTLNLYAVSKADKDIKKYCKIDVVPVPCEKLELNYTKKAARVGEKFELYPVFTPENTSKRIVLWSVGNKSIVSIDSNTGIVTCLKEGTTYVKALWRSGTLQFEAKCDVKVLPEDIHGGGSDNLDFEDWN